MINRKALVEKRLEDKKYKILCLRVLIRDKYSCRICRIRHNLHVHHIVFRSQGGSDTMENLVTLCVDCHSSVHNNNNPILFFDNNGRLKWIIKGLWRPKYKVV